MAWDAEIYLRFGQERTRPALDLIARIPINRPARIIDLGCGPGNSVQVLRERWPQAEIAGLDNSAEMIQAARRSQPEIQWMLADIAAWADPGPYDIVFSNAALQWVPNHSVLFPSLFRRLGSGGVLAVQMPFHLESPLHRLILQLALDPQWSRRLDSARAALRVEPPSFYYDLLAPISSRIDLWETEYVHVLPDPESIIQWIKGTGLRPFLEALAGPGEKQSFEERLLDGVRTAYPRRRDGRVLFPFRRLFLIATSPTV